MHQLSPTDSMMIFTESDPAPNQGSSVLIADQSTAPGGHVRFKQIMAKMESAIEYAPNFGCRLARVPLNLDDPYWVEDPHFDIEFHVRHLALPKPGDWRQFCIQVARLQSRTLDPSRPLWEMYVIEGLDKVKGLPRGCFAIVLKMHHAMIDGMGTMALLSAMLDSEPTSRRRKKPAKSRTAPPEIAPSAWSLTTAAMQHLLKRPGQIAHLLAIAPGMLREKSRAPKPSVVAKGVPNTPFNGAITAARVFDARFYDLEDVKRMRALAPGSTVNDVVLAIIAGALRRYLLEKNALPQETLVVAVPISTRTKEETAAHPSGNEIAGGSVPLCTHIEDPIDRLKAICEVMTSTKSYVHAVGAKTLQEASTALPGALVGTIARAMFAIGRLRGRAALANTVVTNVPGMQHPVYLCGAKVLRFAGVAPLIGTMGLMNVITSYSGQLSISVVGCRDLLPDPEFYMHCIDDSFKEYLLRTKRARPTHRGRSKR